MTQQADGSDRALPGISLFLVSTKELGANNLQDPRSLALWIRDVTRLLRGDLSAMDQGCNVSAQGGSECHESGMYTLHDATTDTVSSAQFATNRIYPYELQEAVPWVPTMYLPYLASVSLVVLTLHLPKGVTGECEEGGKCKD